MVNYDLPWYFYHNHQPSVELMKKSYEKTVCERGEIFLSSFFLNPEGSGFQKNWREISLLDYVDLVGNVI